MQLLGRIYLKNRVGYEYLNTFLETHSMSLHCNIDKTDRINRLVIGVLICIAVLMGMGKGFFMILGLVLILEGIVGWCSIPYLIDKLKRYKRD